MSKMVHTYDVCTLNLSVDSTNTARCPAVLLGMWHDVRPISTVLAAVGVDSKMAIGSWQNKCFRGKVGVERKVRERDGARLVEGKVEGEGSGGRRW